MNPLILVRLLEPPVFLATLLLMVWIVLHDADPFIVVFRPIWRVFTRRTYLLYVLLGLSVVAVNVALTAVDEGFTSAVTRARGQDFTSLIWAMEGASSQYFRQYTWTPLTWYLAWTYIIVFPVMLPCTMVVFDYLGEVRRNISLLIGYILNYVLVLPFYVFFPVRETNVYVHNGEPFAPLALDDVTPAIMTALRPMSGVDNCFPSFHTSLAVTVALFAWRSGRKRLGGLMTFFAFCIMFATIYLGIHWLFDVGAGIILGLVAYFLGDKLGTLYWRWRVSRRRHVDVHAKRRFLLYTTLLVAVALLSFGWLFLTGWVRQATHRRQQRFFKQLPQERLTYQVTSWLGNTGSVIAEVGPLQHLPDGTAAYRITYTLRTTDHVSNVYVLKGQVSTLVDAATLLPLEYEQQTVSGLGITGGEDKHRKLVYNRDENKISYYEEKKKTQKMVLKRTRRIPENAHHFASLLYFIRCRRIQLHENIQLMVSDRKRDVSVRALVLRQEPYRTPYGTRRMALVIQTSSDFGHEEMKAASMRIWLDKEERFPVRLDARIKWGTISARLLKRTVNGEPSTPQ
jgi:membrane-associated phospholipid phosphatase